MNARLTERSGAHGIFDTAIEDMHGPRCDTELLARVIVVLSCTCRRPARNPCTRILTAYRRGGVEARVWAGIHLRYTNEVGVALGLRVARAGLARVADASAA